MFYQCCLRSFLKAKNRFQSILSSIPEQIKFSVAEMEQIVLK